MIPSLPSCASCFLGLIAVLPRAPLFAGVEFEANELLEVDSPHSIA